MTHPKPLSHVAALGFAFVLALTRPTNAAELASSQTNVVRNAGFEDGASGWRLLTEKGVKGGAIVREDDGNHALRAEGDTYWVGAIDYRYFRELHLERYAGKTLRIACDVKGDEDAYPGLVLCFDQAGKAVYKTLLWRVPHTLGKYPGLTGRYQTFETMYALPQNVAAFSALTLYNCTRRGRILFDNISIALAPAKSPVSAAGHAVAVPADWPDIEFTEEELIELSNTCNALSVEWALLYGAVADTQRALHYTTAAGAVTAELENAARAMQQTQRELLRQLWALHNYYIGKFRETFPALCKPERYWDFYNANEQAGKKLLLKVGWRKSAKPEFVAFEKLFADARKGVESLLAALEQRVRETHKEWQPYAQVRRERGDELFDTERRPNHILMGIRSGHYLFHAVKWFRDELHFHPVLAPAFDDSGAVSIDTDDQRAYGMLREWQPYMDFHTIMTCFADPRIRYRCTSPAFKAKCLADPTMRAHTELGPTPAGTRSMSLNIFHPDVRAYLQQFYEQVWAAADADPYAAVLEYAGEPCFYLPNLNGKSYVYGYSEQAKAQFRRGLQTKFPTVAALNEAWRSQHRSFADIAPPTYDMMQQMQPQDLPLIYEFRRFRKQAYYEHFRMIYDAARRRSTKPIMIRWGREYFNGNSLDAFDVYNWAADTADIICHHSCDEGRFSHFATQNYCYSITRYLGYKPRATLEFYIACPTMTHFDWEKDDIASLFHRSVNNLWRAVIWDEKLIVAWHDRMHPDPQRPGPDRRSGMTLAPIHLGALPWMKAKAESGIEDVIFRTRIVTPKIALLAPFDGTMVCQPDAQIAREGKEVHKFLSTHNYDYFCVPEELLVSGRETLSSYKVLFASYALWAATASQEKILRWVADGGVFITVGPFGYWDEYGRPSRLLLDQCFGRIPLELGSAGGVYRTTLPYAELSRHPNLNLETVLPYTEDKQVNLISAAHGRGRVFLATDPGIASLFSGSRKAVLRAVDAAIGIRTAWCQGAGLDLVTREDAKTQERFLFAVNRSITEALADTVVVAGEYSGPQDIAMPAAFPVRARSFGGVTALDLQLGPGEATCIALGPYRESPLDVATITREMSGRTRSRTQEILQPLEAIVPAGDLVAYARAAACRDVALQLLDQEQYAPALQFAEQGAKLCQAPEPTTEPGFSPCTFVDKPVQVDGMPTEWGTTTPLAVGDATLRTAWDPDALYLFLDIPDAHVRNDAVPGRLWGGDSVEVFIDVLNRPEKRKHGLLDFHYTFGPDGAAQVEDGKRITGTRALGLRTKQGYRLEVRIDMAELHVRPVSGYVMGFNVRRLDYGLKDGAFRCTRADLLSPTPSHPSTTTQGYARLRLCGGESQTAPTYMQKTNTLVLHGPGNTLAGVSRALQNASILDSKGNETHLGADLHLARGAELLLGSETIRPRDGLARWRLSAEEGSEIRLLGDPVLLDAANILDLPLSCIHSDLRHTLTAKKRLMLRVEDRNQNPIVDALVVVTASDRGTGEQVMTEELRLDKTGRATLVLPILSLTTEWGQAAPTANGCNITVNDFQATAPYSLREADILNNSEVKVVFTTHR